MRCDESRGVMRCDESRGVMRAESRGVMRCDEGRGVMRAEPAVRRHGRLAHAVNGEHTSEGGEGDATIAMQRTTRQAASSGSSSEAQCMCTRECAPAIQQARRAHVPGAHSCLLRQHARSTPSAPSQPPAPQCALGTARTSTRTRRDAPRPPSTPAACMGCKGHALHQRAHVRRPTTCLRAPK
eukprot:350156-Chlamydomonas_euryale.AAC.4